MFDLDTHLDILNQCVDLMRKYQSMNLTGDLTRQFIHELAEIDDQYHEQLTESFDENVELSKLTDAFMLRNEQVRKIDVNHELNKAIVFAVEEFIKEQLDIFN